ncbi:MAG TPA: NAD(P)-dependent oxidoreductase [Tenuifilaceae bacterium]|nr:NAD(P)-dependent oxidoreductase [Tenuifilaceae bacterium]
MRILITGGSGFIGKYLVDALASTYELFVLGRKKNCQYIVTKENRSVPYITTDYGKASLEQIFERIKPEAVVHLAAQRLEKEKKTADYISNILISIELFKTCLKFNVVNIVNISTISAYSFFNQIPWVEDLVTIPSNEYGLSKKMVEDAALYFNSKGLKIKILRLAQTIGLGEREGYVLQTYLSNALKGKHQVVFGKGEGKRHYIYIKDVIDAIEKCIFQSDKMGIFNIGMIENYSFLQLCTTINHVFMNEAGIEQVKEFVADENVYLMDISKAQRELNWFPRFNLRETYLDIKSDISRVDSK